MDRQFEYEQAIPLTVDGLLINKNAYIGLSKLAGAVFGISNVVVNGANCVPTSPTSLQVQCGPCEVYSLQNIDNSDYGDVPLDTTHQILKQGVNLDVTLLTLTAPGTPGNSKNYLIQFGFIEQDGGSTVLNYYNPDDPNTPLVGPGNSGMPNNTVRYDQVSIQAKEGIEQATGSQATPAPDAGYVGAFVVSLVYGQTTITGASISNYLNNNTGLISETLLQKISQTTADARYTQPSQIQNGQFIYGTDVGSANAYRCVISPPISSYVAGLGIRLKITNNNTGASTLAINGIIPAVAITYTNGSAISSGDMISGMVAELIFDGTNFQLLNPGTSNGTFATRNGIQENTYIYFADTSVTPNAITSANDVILPALNSPTAGLHLYAKIANNNTGATTLRVTQTSGNITFPVKSTNGAALIGGELIVGMIADFLYDGTNLQLMNPRLVSGTPVVYYGDVDTGGVPNVYVTTVTPAISVAYKNGQNYFFRPFHTSTGPSTLNLNGIGALPIVDNAQQPLVDHSLVVNCLYEVIYVETINVFQLVNPGMIGTVRPLDVQGFVYNSNFAGPSGTANAYTMTIPNTLTTSFQPPRILFLTPSASNTGASTLTVTPTPTGSPVTATIYTGNFSDLLPNQILVGQLCIIYWNGSNFLLLNPFTLTANAYSPVYIVSTSASTTTYVGEINPTSSGGSNPGFYPTTGQPIYWKVNMTNTGAVTLQLNTSGSPTTYNVKKSSGSALSAGNIVANMIAQLVYDGTNFQLLNPQ